MRVSFKNGIRLKINYIIIITTISYYNDGSAYICMIVPELLLDDWFDVDEPVSKLPGVSRFVNTYVVTDAKIY